MSLKFEFVFEQGNGTKAMCTEDESVDGFSTVSVGSLTVNFLLLNRDIIHPTFCFCFITYTLSLLAGCCNIEQSRFFKYFLTFL